MSGKTKNWANNQITDPAEQFNLGFCYYHGDGVPQDYQQAVYWYRRAAEQGESAAQCNLGRCYYCGDGVPQDYQQAVYWLRKAAVQGHCEAQYNLGICYENGDGVPQDYQQAVYWYRKAAEQGDTDAKHKLRTCRVRAISHTKGLENMWKINWKLVSALVIIGGLISFFIYPGKKTAIAIILIIAMFITAHMSDESEIRAEAREKELIKKYYNMYGDFTYFTFPRRQDVLEELTKEIERETGRKLSVKIVSADASLIIHEITRNRGRQ